MASMCAALGEYRKNPRRRHWRSDRIRRDNSPTPALSEERRWQGSHVCRLPREPGFDSKKSQFKWLGSFAPTRLPQTLDRRRRILAGAPRRRRVVGRWARSARQKSRDGPTGGIGLGSTVLGSRDLVRIVARSREMGTWGLRLDSNR
jgi:hypothetical protein